MHQIIDAINYAIGWVFCQLAFLFVFLFGSHK